MLSVTPTAAILVRDLTAGAQLPDGAGLRIDTNPDTLSLTMGLAVEPEAADEVVDSHGARVFLAPGTSGRLRDRTLEAEVGEDRTRFFLEP